MIRRQTSILLEKPVEKKQSPYVSGGKNSGDSIISLTSCDKDGLRQRDGQPGEPVHLKTTWLRRTRNTAHISMQILWSQKVYSNP